MSDADRLRLVAAIQLAEARCVVANVYRRDNAQARGWREARRLIRSAQAEAGACRQEALDAGVPRSMFDDPRAVGLLDGADRELVVGLGAYFAALHFELSAPPPEVERAKSRCPRCRGPAVLAIRVLNDHEALAECETCGWAMAYDDRKDTDA